LGRTDAFYLAWIASGAASDGKATIDPNQYLGDVKFLASPALRGRVTGSPELEKAAAFIAGKFHEFRLKPPEGTHYYQDFPVTTAARAGSANRFHFTENGHTVALHFPEDFVPFNFSHAGKLTGAVVFAGYGITAPEYNYD